MMLISLYCTKTTVMLDQHDGVSHVGLTPVCPRINVPELIWSLERNKRRNENFRLRITGWKKIIRLTVENKAEGGPGERCRPRQIGKHRWKCIKMTSSQYDRLVRKTPSVGGQLVTVGGLTDMISSSAGAKVPWHTDTCCQYAHILTHIHAEVHKHTLLITNKQRAGTCCHGDANPWTLHMSSWTYTWHLLHVLDLCIL